MKLWGIILAVGMAVLISPAVFSQGLANAANLIFIRQMVVVSEDGQMLLPYLSSYRVPSNTSKVWSEQAIELLDRAVRNDPDNTHLRWNLARINLAVGNASAASELLSTTDCRLHTEPLRYLDTLIAHSRADNYQTVITLYESLPLPSELETSSVSPFARQTSDLVALAYMARAKERMADSDKTSVLQDSQQALLKRPSDLYALYNLFKIQTQLGRLDLADIHRQELVQFSASGLEFADPRLADLTAEAISQLVADGLWTKTTALNVAATLVWRKPDSEGTLRLLQRLAKYYPNEPEWRSFLDEARWRNEQRQQPQGNVASLHSSLGSNVLPPSLSDTPQVVAEMLSMPQETIRLEQNLLPNSSFEEQADGQPLGWRGLTLAMNMPHDRALFYPGRDSFDSFSGTQSARISGLWIGKETSRGRPNSGFWLWDESGSANRLVPLESGETYVISFHYRTEWTEDNQVAIYLNAGTDPLSSFGGEYYLPATGGSWRKAVLVGTVGPAAKDYTVSPFLRLWGVGQVWFDDIELRSVSFLSSPPTLTRLLIGVR